MARKDDPEPADDFDDDTPAPKRKGFPVWGWFLFAGGIIVIVCGGGSVVMAMLWTGARTTTAGTLPGKVEATVYMREDFRKLVLGKTPEQVIAAVGRPDDTRTEGAKVKRFDYYNRTRDPITGKIDSINCVSFTNGISTSTTD